MRVRSFIISLIFAVAVIASMVVFAGASGALFVNVPAFMVVVLMPIVLLRASFSFNEMGVYFRLVFRLTESQETGSSISRSSGHRTAEIKQAVLFFKAMRSYLLSAGFIGGMVGTITMLADLSDTSRVGFGAALVLLTILYALVVSTLLVLPLCSSLEKQLSALEAGD